MRHFRSIEEAGVEGVRKLLDLADHMAEVNRRPNPKVPALRGKTVCNVFFEDSTRTRLSFETAAKRLSADIMNFAVSSSSVNKGESLRDTIETIAAMGVDAFVIRHKSSGVPWQVEQWTNAAVINAGDGWHAHPTQALLDCYTIRTALNRRDSFDGLKIAIVGDIKHSRVARSDIQRVHAARRRRHAGGTAHAAAAIGRRAHHHRPRRRHRRRGRALPAADAARAHDRIAGAVPA